MNFKKQIILCASAATLALMGCGENAVNVNKNFGVAVLASGQNIYEQTCDYNNTGDMLFVQDSAATFFCNGIIWMKLKGKNGANGKNGLNGENGENGLNGTNGLDGKNGVDGTAGTSGKSCNAEPIANGYKIVCNGDSVGVLLNGAQGEKGDTGKKGNIGATGLSGNKGPQGDQGAAGKDGQMCYSERFDDGYIVYCDSLEVGRIYDGKQGDQGEKGDNAKFESGYTGSFIDNRDGHVYKFVVIGGQIWMAENLNYNSGNDYCYSKDNDNCNTYGRLYTMYTAKTICPDGWHLSTYNEWANLIELAGGTSYAGGTLKSTTGWDTNSGTDLHGFKALPGGFVNNSYNFSSISTSAYMWANYDGSSYRAKITSSNDEISLSTDSKCTYAYVRCVKD